MKDVHLSFIEGNKAPSELFEFIRRAYQKTYGTSPGVAKLYAIALRHGKVAGCLGMEEAGPDGRFPIERIYGLDREKMPVPLDHLNTLQFGRLVARERSLTPLILYAGSHFGLRSGKIFGLIEHSLVVHRVLCRLGIRFEEIGCGPANLEFVPEEDRAYYAKQEMRPYVADLRAVMKVLEPHVPKDAIRALSAP